MQCGLAAVAKIRAGGHLVLDNSDRRRYGQLKKALSHFPVTFIWRSTPGNPRELTETHVLDNPPVTRWKTKGCGTSFDKTGSRRMLSCTILTNGGIGVSGVLASCLASHLRRHGVTVRVWGQGVRLLRLCSGSRGPLAARLARRVLAFAATADLIVVVAPLPPSFLRSFMDDAAVRRVTGDTPIVLYQNYFLPDMPGWVRAIARSHRVKTGINGIQDALIPASPEPFAADGVIEGSVLLQNIQCHSRIAAEISGELPLRIRLASSENVTSNT